MAPSILSKSISFLRIKEDEHGQPVNRWTNADILPVLPEHRTYTTKSYMGFWVAAGVAATYWTMGSTAIANGLDAGTAVGAMIVGGIISAGISWGCGEFGIKYCIGFPMLSRAVFGMYGSYFVVVLKCFSNFVYSGIQAYWGGIAMRVMLSAIFPTFHRMRNSFPESANITTKDFIGTMIYFAVFVPLLWVKPYKMNKFFLVSFCGVVATIVGMFIWAMAATGGNLNVVSPTRGLMPGDRAFRFFQGICTLATTYTGAPRLGIWIACPLTVIVSAVFGILVTSACQNLYGEIIWQPMTLLAHIQEVDYSATTRAGTFFAGLGWFLSQVAINYSSNAIATGMDLASVVPEFLNARRGSLILAVVAIGSCPWNMVNSPGTFITVISSLGIFISPLIGIYIADFCIIRKGLYKIPDLYVGNKSSIYWFQFGFHWRGFLTWLSLIWVSLPGFIGAIRGRPYAAAWTKIFQLSFLIGLVGGILIYTIVCKISPPPGIGEYVPWDVSTSSHSGEGKDLEKESMPLEVGDSKASASVNVRTYIRDSV